MTTTAKATQENINLSNPAYYLNRELSWLEFNRRVLHEAFDPRTPLLERLKFTAIFSSNLDEFFMVRVAILKEQVEAQVSRLTPDGRSPKQQLIEICQQLRPMVVEQHRFFEQTLRPQLETHGIYLLNYIDLNQEQRLYLQQYFEKRIFPVLTPLAIDPAHPFPHISNLSLNLAVLVKDPQTDNERFARVKVPNSLPRFITLPENLQVFDKDGHAMVWAGIPLEQVVAHNLDVLFPGMAIQEYYPFRITRDADFEVSEDEADDLLLAIEQELRRRRFGGSVVRMEVYPSMPENIRQTLMEEMELVEGDIYEVEGLLNLKDLFALAGLPLPELKDEPWPPVLPARLRSPNDEQEAPDMFTVIRNGDLLVHHPYESFSATVEQFIYQAAHDSHVLAIKMTLYRTSGDSPIVNALIAAAQNGKQVAALVELKARFDEENNITWARKLEDAGVHVVYGVVGLKTHTKVVLVVRQENEEIRRYVHIGTGNYNSKTARLYTDLGLLSCRDELGADLTDLFNYLTGYSRQHAYRKLLVAPVNLRDRMSALIRREIDHARDGRDGRIIAKMNSLVDAKIIVLLYEASQAGVKIDLIIRGICCLRPGIEGVSENIRVISIIGRLLEHSRIFYFGNGGEEEVYIGSADWMPRNLDRRVEAITPVEDPALMADLKEQLDIFMDDNRQCWDLHADGTYTQRRPDNGTVLNAQEFLMQRAVEASQIR
ncbi:MULTISPECIES: polyphosphate kinase 1 [unclassified Leptolyngbya]|uniref:polyphosphate kinase 1 n=1 Tax=unclassified Leptolyngbya TaxID=2650499 RepID=UPI001684B870|nr:MULTISPECIES: polyphosphate kinase 1 [unclassified Leptolyngbya]MBD1911419.1 polyphosphate kinase 1 [Leptolyngbya sp. FACHB-8]MBD2159045.1 polyphosphate kinase 1 [Leptolyngbya sp. FACHB-16]